MKLTVANDADQGARVNISGKVTQHDFTSSQEPIAERLGPSVYGRHVTLDLTDTMYFDSAGVGWLLTCHKRIREAGGTLKLENVPSIVANLLRLLKLSRLLGVDPPGPNDSFQAEGLA